MAAHGMLDELNTPVAASPMATTIAPI